jgi:RNA polymerase sigma factor (sigma-70 family)
VASFPAQSRPRRPAAPLSLIKRETSSRTAHGDPASFSALYEQHHQELFRYCRSIVRHEQDAQDVLQNTMVKAFSALQGEDRELDIRPWLFRIAHNEAISLLRRRRETREMPDLAELGGSMDERVIEREDLRALQADLADLSETQRAALVLRELNGLGHAEIALVLDSSPQSVKQSIYEARSALLESREGREMACEAIRRTLSDADGRALRGRRLRAHLRSCSGCRQFKTDLVQRPRDLAAMAPPLPAAASAALLHHLLAGSGKAAGGTFASAGAGAGGGMGGVVGVLGTKAAITAAILATAAAGTAIVTHPFTHHSGAGAGHSGTGAHAAPGASSARSALSGAQQPGGLAATTRATPGHGVSNSVAGATAASSASGVAAPPAQASGATQPSSSALAHGKAGVTVTSGQAGGHARAPSVSTGHRAHGGSGHRTHSATGHRAGGNSGHHSSGHVGVHGGSSGAHGNSGAGGSAPAQPAPSGGGSGQAPSGRHGGSTGPTAPSLPKLPKLPGVPKHP